jgi:hypothetical protein
MSSDPAACAASTCRSARFRWASSGFGHHAEPQRQYDLVANVFVLNVLPDPWQRIRAIQHAATFTRAGGYLLVVTRSPADIDPRAAVGSWPQHHDGFWSNEAKGTFQVGIARDEIVAIARRAGLSPAHEEVRLVDSVGASQALLAKPA